MTQLLVSVRNAEEAREAMAGCADLVDVKEPSRGALGAASPQTWQAVRVAVRDAPRPEKAPPEDGSRCCLRPVALSAACGELLESDWTGSAEGLATDIEKSLAGFAYAKVGLAGADTGGRLERRSNVRWEEQWERWVASLPSATAPVAVVYADYRSACAPRPATVLALAETMRVRTLLIDTYDKTRGDLFAHLAACELADVIDQARELGMQVALAGSIGLCNLSTVLRFAPDIIAVRGAVCRDGRESQLVRELVNRFRMHLSTPLTSEAIDRATLTIDSDTPRA